LTPGQPIGEFGAEGAELKGKYSHKAAPRRNANATFGCNGRHASARLKSNRRQD
jgi:hypothetical protein